MQAKEKLNTGKSSSQGCMPLTYCIIVNWNGWKDTIACLDSLKSQHYSNLKVIVVDNGSTNDSVQRIRQQHDWVTVIESGRNGGFAFGNNIGIRCALAEGAEYIWLLNNDTVVHVHTLQTLISTALSDPSLGEIGSVLLYAHAPNQVQAWGGGTINLWTSISRHYHAPINPNKLDYLTAASVLLPARTLEHVGLLDEEYFMYWEDVDLSYRIREAGWELGVSPNATLLHKEGGSSRGNKPKLDAQVTASGIRFLRKFAPFPVVPICMLVFGRAIRRFAQGRWNCGWNILFASLGQHKYASQIKRT